jgi:MFS family permease
MAFVCAMVCVDTLFYTALTPLLPYYTHVAGLSKAGAGVLVACYPMGMLAGALPGGLLASRLGYRLVAVAGLAMMSVSTAIFGLASAAPLLDAARFTEGMAGACTWAAGLGWVASAGPADRRGEMLGTVFGAGVVGALLGPVIGTVAAGVGTARAFALAAVVGVGLIMAAVAVPEETEESPDPFGMPAQGLGAACRGLREPRVVAGMLMMMLPGIGLGVLNVLAPLRLSQLGATPLAIGVIFLGAAVTEAAMSPLAGRMSDRHGVFTPARLLLLAAMLVSLLAPVLRPASVLAVVLVLGLPAFGTLYTPAAAVLTEGADYLGLNQGLAFGLANFAWAGGMAIAAVTSGTVAQATSDRVPYLLLAGVCVLAFAALPLAARAGRRARAVVPEPPLPPLPPPDPRELEYAGAA